jgi:hypothetical protein
MTALNFNASTVAPASSFDPLPAGWYNARITGSEMKPTKDGKGSYLNLTMTVIDGKYANQKIFDRLNLNNKNETAVKIAYETLSAICHATGIIQLQDSSQLHGIPMQVKVSVRDAEGSYSASNEVKGYKAMEGAGFNPAAPANSAAPNWVKPASAPTPAAPAWAPTPPQQGGAPAAPPWAQQ